MKKLILITLGLFISLQSLPVNASTDEHGHDHKKDYESMISQVKEFESSPAFKPEILSTAKSADIIYGDQSAPVRIVEYASLSCGSCKNFSVNIMPEIKQKLLDTKKAHLVYRHFALNNSALKAASLVNCAKPEAKQNFIAELFTKQEQWAFIEFDYEMKRQLQVISKPYLNEAEFSKCYDDSVAQDNILKDMKLASEGLLIKSTPSIYVNGKRFTGAGKDALIKYIEELK